MVYTLMFEPQGLMRTNFVAAGNSSEHGDRLRWRIGNAHRLSLTTDNWPLATAFQRAFPARAHWVQPAKTQQLRPHASEIPRRAAWRQASTSQMRVMPLKGHCLKRRAASYPQPVGRHSRSLGRKSWVSKSHQPESLGDGTIRPPIRASCVTPEGVQVLDRLYPGLTCTPPRAKTARGGDPARRPGLILLRPTGSGDRAS